MTDDDEWKKLPTDQKVAHKAWKARAAGYQECIKSFPTLDEKSPEFSKYLGLIKKFVTDSNQLVRIQGVEAANLFVQNAHVAGKTVSEVVGGVILQCFNSKPKLKEMGVDLILNYIEIDKPEQVMEELIKGFENKQPKIVNSCVECATKALSEFGSKVVHVKSLMSSCKKLVDHRDKAVRQSTKLMIVEIYRWIKDAIRVPLQSINPVVLKELESEWDELKNEKTKQQTRFMRSQQDLREKFEQKQSQAVDGSSAGGDTQLEDEVEEQVDPYDLMEPVDILSKLPKTFYDEIEAKKWQERKKMLDVVEKLSENPRLAQGDYADLLKALKKVVAKDTNIMLVTIAIKCIGGIARGLRNKFQPYALLCLESMFERFKEKKATVLQALKDATDAAGGSIPITNIQDSLLEYLAHKNPSVRAHVGHFVSRMVMKMKAQQLNKTLLKTLLAPLIKNLSDGTPDVRDGSYSAIAACMNKIGENKIAPFLADLDKIKMDKIRDSAAKLSPAAVASGGDAGKEVNKTAASVKNAPAAKKQPPAKKSSSAASVKSTGPKKSAAAAKSSSKPAAKKEETFEEMELGEDDVVSKFDDMFSSDIKSQILNSVWKERFAGLQAAHAKLKIMSSEQIACQAIVKFLAANKPGYKDSNFNCLNEKFAILKYLAENSFFSIKSVDSCLSSLVDKVGDIKCGPASRECLSSICEATSFPKISQQIMEYGMSQKNPKVQSETLKWFSNALVEFGIDGVDTKFVIKFTKSALSHTNMAVRKGALDVVRSLAMFLGEMVKNLFGDEKAALQQQIDQQVEAVKGEAKPKPIRGKKSKSSSGAGGNDDGGDGNDDDVADDDDEAGGSQLNMEDLLPRVDISGKITDELLGMLGDSKWKDRKQALDSIVDILNQAKYIENKLGDLPQELKKRFKDSNKLLLITTLEILTQLGEALGSRYLHEYLPTFLEGVVTSLADSKPKVRQTALACMEKWSEKSKLVQWFNNDEIASCLANPRHTFLRIELMKWLGEKMLKCKPFSNPAARENVELCAKHVFQCCEDRNSDVRSSAAEILPALIYHLNYKKMLQLANKMPASSKNAIIGLIESANEKVPKAQPKAASTKATASSGGDEKKVVRPASSKAGGDAAAKMKSDEPSVKKEGSKKEEGKKSALKKPGSAGASSQKGGKSAAAPEDSVGAFIAQKNGKELRYKEERQLKVLKWAFAAPRDELLQQLRQQMSLCINSSLLADMFHQDSNKHKKVIDKLNQSLTSEWKGTIDNFDVILRWYTIRFYDNNTTIHLKSFEYLHNLFRKVQQAGLNLSDYEALAFLPHLIIKIGDSKENIRNNVHSLLELMMETYDEKKIYQQIMIGTKSKNAKQRTGCLDVIGKMIRKYSTSVCDPTLPKACKDIAAFISDRDKTVRDSALNAIVCVYEDMGELTYKCVGKLNEKDLSMLEERIKRSANKPKPQTASRPQTSASTLNQSKLQPKVSSKQQPKQQEESAEASSNQQQQPSSTTTTAATPAYQPLGLPDDVKTLLKKITDTEEKLKDFNNDEELPHYEAPDWLKNKETSPAAKETIDLVISRLVSNDNSACLKAVHEMYEIMRKICDKGKYDLLTDCVGQLLTSAARKFRMLRERSLPEVISYHSSDEMKSEFLKLSQSYFTVVNMVFKSRELLKCITYYELYDFLRSIMSFVVDPRLKKVQDCDMFIKSINVATFEVANNTDPLLLVCATIKLVDDALTSAPYLKSYKEKGDEEAMINTLEYYHIALKLHVRVIKRITNPKPDDLVYGDDKLSEMFTEIDTFWAKYPLSSQFTAIFADNMPLIKSPYKDAAFMLKTLKTTQTAVYERLKQQVIPHLHGVMSNRSSSTMTFMCNKFSLNFESLKNQIFDHQESRKSSSSSNDKPPVALASKLDDIFKKIKKTDTFDQAMVELFEFQRQHPHHDVEAKIESLELNCFKNYVRSNLKIMAIEKNENIDESSKRRAVCDEIVSNSTDNKNILNDINQLRACCGLNPLQEEKAQLTRPQKSLLKPMASREPSQLRTMTSSSSIASSRSSNNSGGGGSHIPTTTSNHNFSDLKKRFQALKDRANLKNN